MPHLKRSEMRRHRAGQALLEFAIFGSLALFALAFLIQIGLRVNYQQEIDQQTFRSALAKSDSYSVVEPPGVSYVQFRDRQMPSPADGFAVMPRVSTQGSASVVWGTFLGNTDVDDRDGQQLTVVRVNNTEREFREEDFEDLPEDAPWVSKINRTLTSRGTVQQTNAASSSLSASTDQTTTVVLKNNDAVSSTVTSNVNWNW